MFPFILCKKAEKADFGQQTVCEATGCWSKYTTVELSNSEPRQFEILCVLIVGKFWIRGFREL